MTSNALARSILCGDVAHFFVKDRNGREYSIAAPRFFVDQPYPTPDQVNNTYHPRIHVRPDKAILAKIKFSLAAACVARGTKTFYCVRRAADVSEHSLDELADF